MRSLSKFVPLLALIVLLASQVAIAQPRRNAACSSLLGSLGANKVFVTNLQPQFTESQARYYSTDQAVNRPACVVRPAGASDVSTAMRAIRDANSTMAIKAGGHQTNNFWSSTSGGVLIDLINMKTKTYDAASQTGFWQPGNRWDDLYKYYEQFNVVPVGGRLSEVGSGLALGGGLSYLSAEYGYSCDQFKSLDVVLADGRQVTATANNEFSDLFLSLKGGGNQFGIVVGYTADVVPIGDCFGGLLIYGADQIDAVYAAALNFTNNNQDPKAAIIGTLNVVGTPGGINLFGFDVLSGLDSFMLLFNVYNGPEGRAVFQQFEDIPHIADTRMVQKYSAIADMVDIGATQFGAQIYRASVQRSNKPDSLQTLNTAIREFRAFAERRKGQYTILSFDFQPVPASLVEASRARGDNALRNPDGPFYYINYLITFPNVSPTRQALLADHKRTVERVPNEPGIPIFLNDANADQPILQSYGAYQQLVDAKRKYDPTNFLATNMGGPRV